MNNFTEGVSKEDMDSILANLKKLITNDTYDSLNDYQKLFETIKSYWVGKDCDVWCNNLLSLIKEIEKSLDNYYDQIEKEFNKIFSNWEEFQLENVTDET